MFLTFNPLSADPKKWSNTKTHQRCSLRKCVLRNFKKFTGKHLCQSLFFDKDAGLRPATLLKRDSNTGVSCEYCKSLRTAFL